MARLLRERLDELVAPAIREPRQRRLHAWAIGLLIATGLAATVASPVLAALGTDVTVVVAPLVLAGLLLAAAAYLSNRGSLDAAAWLYGTLAIAGTGAAAAASDLLSPAWLLALLVLPAEALLAGRRHLALALAGSLLATAVTVMPMAGLPGLELGVGNGLLAVLLLSYAGVAARRLLARRQVRAASLRASEAPDLSAAADFFDAAWLRLERDGTILRASAAARTLLAMDGTLGEGLFARIHPADQAGLAAALIGVGHEAAPQRVELRLRRRDGTWRPSVAALAAAPGGAAVDVAITALVEDRPDARALQTALETANQSSAAKSHFLAAVSHELRTPLNAIIGFSDILHQEFFGGFESERQKEYVGLIRQSGQHLLSVVNSLLDVSKIEAGRYELVPESFSPSEAMALAADVVRDEALQKGLRLDLRPCHVEAIVADRRACHQILLNLLSNAVKFTDSGVVTLEARADVDSIEICVSDTGIGIAEADIDTLGQPFVQVSCGTARRYQGTGLGLSLVKGLVELHGGSFAMSSRPAIGTMVTVRLPRDCTKTEESSFLAKENIVALSDARTKTNTLTKPEETRRTA
ncbi:HAMP domain-containing sensor histidine kinase [Aurantimonas sp. HBX-1]|uniref:sensor histidine kinase n=1 Tax=Aurantimonas sp. HBX-1 TaxID=2906072 RepID=UPI001F27CB84|nr:PAS domain-containing sensor histidine kinase [Aurantimonas sp. HBX-1]UIJ70653.1 PAS domain-containing sensor histidine kinase [Aurantimonas sp. HBX-1]